MFQINGFRIGLVTAQELLAAVAILLFADNVQAQKVRSLIQAGPMVGHADFREVQLWVQTTESATVRFSYQEKGSSGVVKYTTVMQASRSAAFVVKAVADEVTPGKTYTYIVEVNGKRVAFDYPLEFKTPPLWRKDKRPPEFSIALGSCAFINDSLYDDRSDLYGGEYQIFQSIHEKRPDLMIWLGDNVYLREADWTTRTGIYHRYTHTRSLRQLQPLLASTHHYACWDDHDYGPNDSDRSFIHKNLTLEAFQHFWCNPSYGLANQDGITTQFRWGDVDFFILDNRFYRSPQNRTSGPREMFGEQQIEWLIDALVFSDAAFKVVVSGALILSGSSDYRNQNYISNYSEERAYLLKRIEDEGLKNVIFFTGDKHFTEVSRLKNKKGIWLYDITVSPLTSRANTRQDDNMHRVEGSLIQRRNFAIVKVTGPLSERKLDLSIFDSDGSELWKYTILQTP